MAEERRVFADGGGKRGLEEAASYVSKGWMPVNGELLAEIQKKLKAGYYQDEPRLLLCDLKKDIALFTFCLRRLQDIVDRESRGYSPAQILTSMEADSLEALFNVSEDQISAHKFSENAKPQALCLKHALITSATAESLADKASLDSDLAFTCASVRQLGLNLVAWNYPRIYTKALAAVSNQGEELDVALGKVLGYSPTQLGIKVALGWSTSPEVRTAVGLDEHSKGAEKPDEKSAASQIRHFCDIGEALARVNDAEHFPGAASRWEEVVSEIKHHLGPHGLSIISSKLEQNSEFYTEVSEALFKIDESPQKHLKVAQSQQAQRMLQANNYVPRCPSEIQERFQELYGCLVPGGVSTTAINLLVGEIMPALGFTQGCIYLVDAKNTLLVPMLRVGKAPLSRYRPLNCADSGGKTSHPVVDALSYSAPIIQENVVLNGDQVSHVTGVFGNRDKTGVLYLEMSGRLVEADRQVPITYFKAVRHTLNDCLNLGNQK